MQERVIVLRSDPQLIFPTQSFPRPLMFIRTGWNFVKTKQRIFLIFIYACIFSASVNSGSADEQQQQNTNLRLPIGNRAPNQQQRRRSNANRQLSLSPSMRRSPIQRLKERRRIGNTQRVSELSHSISPSNVLSRFSQISHHHRNSKFSIFRRAQHFQSAATEPTPSSLQQQVSSRFLGIFEVLCLSSLSVCIHK